MECALVKLHCPRKMFVKEWPEDAYIELMIRFNTNLPVWHNQPNASLTTKNPHTILADESWSERYDINLSALTRQDLINQFDAITEKMNEDMSMIWRMRYKNKLPIEYRRGELHYPLIIHNRIKIIQNGKLEPEDGKILVEDFASPQKIKDEVAMFAYFNFSEKLHEYLNLGVEYPLSEYVPLGFEPDPNGKYKNISKLFVRVKSIPSNEIKIRETDVNLVYVYCDIIMESLINEQRANILQTFVLDSNSSEDEMQTIESRELQFIPLRVDYISSLTIQLCDSERRVLNYEKGRLCCVLKLRPIEII